MTHPIIASPRRPKLTFDAITQLGLKAHALALLHVAAIGSRLPAGLIDALGVDLTSLDVVLPNTKQVRAEVHVATVAHADATRMAYDRFSAARTAARKRATSPETRRAYCVGRVVRTNAPDEVRAAIKSMLDRAAEHPEEAASIGLLQKDLDALTAAHAAITGAGTAQSQKRASAPLTTKARNQNANRILAAVSAISAAGILEFADDEITRASFAALKPSRRRKAQPPAKPADAIPAASTAAPPPA